MCLNRTSEWKVMTNFNYSRVSVVQFRVSPYMMLLNRTSVWKVMTIWISRDLPWFNFGRLHMWCAWIGPPCEKLWPFEILESFHCSISSVLIYDAPESDIKVKSCAISIFLELPLFNFERLDIWCSWIGPPCEKLWQFEFLEIFRC